MPLNQIARFIAVLNFGAIALAMFHDHFTDRPSRRKTRAQHAAVQEKKTSQQTPIHSWRCPQCDHENRALRSTNQRSQTPECARCHNDFIVARCSPRKSAHKELLDDRPIQMRTPYRVGNDILSPNFIIQVNEHALPNTSMYERFCRHVKWAGEKDIQLAFHGTSLQAAQLICKNGMDPSKRINTQGDWFTLDINYALTRAICREEHMSSGYAWGMSHEDEAVDVNRRHIVVIVFAVFMPKTIYIGEHIVCTCHKHSLPISWLEFPREAVSGK